MKIFTFALISMISFSTSLFTQDNKCNCLDNLTKLIAKTEENYAGFPTKVNESSSEDYQNLIKKLQLKAKTEQSPKICFYLLKEYVRFFKDKHFILSYTDEKDYDTEKIKYSDIYFKNAISKKQLNEIEGIWINADTSLKIAIQKTATTKAVAIASTNLAPARIIPECSASDPTINPETS